MINFKLPKIKRVKEFLFFALLVFLPFNIRHIFNYEQIKNIEGFREHISWSISAFDLVFLLLLSVFVFDLLVRRIGGLLNTTTCRIGRIHDNDINKELDKSNQHSFNLKNFARFSYIFLFVALLFSLFLAQNKAISLNTSIRLVGAFVFFLISMRLFQSSRVKKLSILIIFLGGVLQSLISLMQFVAQKSLGLKLLGESVISPNILGVAKFEFAGEKFIRGYGTFPHPNILGAFLLFALAGGIWMFLKKKNGQNILGNVGLIAGNALIIVGIFLSYSRSIVFVLVIFLITLMFAYKNFIINVYQNYCKKLRVHFYLQGAIGLILVFSVLFVLYNLLVPRLCITNCQGDNSIILRLLYNKAAFSTISEHPAFGVGPGCFVSHLSESSLFGLQPWERQPVHNLYLLIASELGLLGLMTFLFFMLNQISAKHIFKKKLLSDPLVIIFFMFLILGFFDHYFWTTPQAQTTFWLSLAFFSSSSRIKT